MKSTIKFLKKDEKDEKFEITYPQKSNAIKINGIQEIDLSAGGQYIVCRFNNKDGKINISNKNGVTYYDM